MKKILFVISSLESYGGMERVASIIANVFDQRGYTVLIVTRDNDNCKTAFALSEDVKVVNCPGNLFVFLKSVSTFVQVNKINYVISHNMGKMTLALSLLNFQKYDCHFISFEHIAYVSSPLLLKKLKHIAYKKVDKVAVLTSGDSDSYRKFHNDVFIVNNPSSFKQDKEIIYNIKSKTIISLGRLTYQKGYDMFLNAWAIIEEKHPDWCVEIYGVGKDLKDLEILKKKLALKKIHFRGLATDSKIVYTKASFYVMSSRFEGLPMVLIEAQTLGLPIVSFDCPHGPSDIIKNGVNGILVENGNVEKLALAIEKLIENNEFRKQLSVKSLENAKKYNLENIFNQWETVLNANKT